MSVVAYLNTKSLVPPGNWDTQLLHREFRLHSVPVQKCTDNVAAIKERALQRIGLR